ncbi:MAG: hypothetical protein KA764_14435 [Anaerolineales bacterium]|nr:hypothetical protein [Anaerolineales bacterium]
MAVLFPETLPITTSPDIARFFSLFKKLPDADYAVWHRLSIHPEPGPDFWIRGRDGRGLLIKVAALTSAGAQVFGQSGLFAAGLSRPAEAEHQALTGFMGRHFAAWPEASAKLPVVVVFPNLEEPELVRLRGLAEVPAGVAWAGREKLSAQAFPHWLEEAAGQPLTQDEIARVRAAFTPEVVIPAALTVRSDKTERGHRHQTRELVERYTTARLTPFLLDYDQERALKTDLDLTDEARATVNDFNLRLINGVAGSGKSLIVVYRAMLLRQLYPHKKILGLTHNQPLIHDLQARYQTLNPAGKAVQWQTFYQWCRQLWPAEKEFKKPIGIGSKEKLVTDVWHAHLADTPISEQMLHDEIDWCKDRLIFSRADYLAADRAGRGFALNEAQRQKLFTAFEAYQAELNRRGRMDWGDVPRQIWRWLQAGDVKLPQYDALLVDEAQFFAPIWFELIKRAVKPGVGHLFLVADPKQGFLKRRQSWAAVGLEVRGRVHRLKKSYRTTREILDFATLLYRTRLPEDDDDLVPPDLLEMPGGAFPEVIPLTSEQDEITRVVNEVERLVKEGLPKRHILIIHANWQGQDRLLERLRLKLGAEAVVDPKEAAPHSPGAAGTGGDAIRVCTLNAVTGLESPIVFLCGVHQLFEQEQSLRLSDDERAELVHDNTRKLYMALTRAGQRVVLTYVGDLPPALVACLPA